DALESFLGLDQLTDAAKRLAVRTTHLREPVRIARQRIAAVRPLLEQLDDTRARSALTELKKRKPAVAAVRALLAGDAHLSDSAIGRLASLSKLAVAPASAASAAADELNAAVVERAKLTVEISAARRSRDELLSRALAFHDEHGSTDCPVCGSGRL